MRCPRRVLESVGHVVETELPRHPHSLLASPRLPGLVRLHGAARRVRRLPDWEVFASLGGWMAKRRPPTRIPSRARREALAEAIAESLTEHPDREFVPKAPEPTNPDWEIEEQAWQLKSDWAHLHKHASGSLEPHCPRCRRALIRIAHAEAVAA